MSSHNELFRRTKKKSTDTYNQIAEYFCVDAYEGLRKKAEVLWFIGF